MISFALDKQTAKTFQAIKHMKKISSLPPSPESYYQSRFPCKKEKI